MKTAQLTSDNSYTLFDRIDGSHPFKEAVPNGYVDYPVRTRHGGRVAFFNFLLAKEMGLIPSDHPEQLTAKLSAKILETFSLVIINEYDQIHNIQYPKKDIRPNKYMATRYLQLQHPDKRGKTSGDGRGIWNGCFKYRGTSWDVSSSGTGATCLSPACAQEKKYFKTGDRSVGYGNGYNTLDEGISAALMSEIFHRNGVPTERTLAIVAFRDGTSINVRASKCLLRPSHFFHHLKQGALEGLRGSIDFFIDRQIANGTWQAPDSLRDKRKRYEFMAEQMALTFARTAALFESNYIFCWLDWDGDNILANGGIIDYGSVRQFGLYHRGYRYEDVDRYSTNLPEQKAKARYIVQNFAQIRDFLITGRKRNIRRYRNDPLLQLFERHFQKTLNDLILQKMGFSEKQRSYLLHSHMGAIESFRKHYAYFERTQSKKKAYRVPDGITRDAVFCMREIMREFPKLWLQEPKLLSAERFIEIIRASYAKRRDVALSPYRLREVELFQKSYLDLVQHAADHFYAGSTKRILLELCMRSSIINRSDRITGDATIKVTQSLIRNLRQMSAAHVYQVIDVMAQNQQFVPVSRSQNTPGSPALPRGKARKLVEQNLELIQNLREGL
ncbi:MAG: protein adenylyltransferase SelO family protein [Bdellovibrionia bacterium]